MEEEKKELKKQTRRKMTKDNENKNEPLRRGSLSPAPTSTPSVRLWDTLRSLRRNATTSVMSTWWKRRRGRSHFEPNGRFLLDSGKISVARLVCTTQTEIRLIILRGTHEFSMLESSKRRLRPPKGVLK